MSQSIRFELGDPHAKYDAIDRVLDHEGEYSNHPDDRGGETNYGITDRTWREYRRKKPLRDEDGNKYPDGVIDITRDHAYDFYMDLIEQKNITSLPAELQAATFDFTVNAGNNAIQCLQLTLNQLNFKRYTKLVTVDGYIGKKTALRAMQIANYCKEELRGYRNGADYIVDIYTVNRIRYYKDLASRVSGQHVFLKGWTERARTYFSWNYA